ncbi:RDD family protein [Prochlorothrix hollandica]|uniref:RDD domain-containing protein n=1 Tax=Prochlorothrix hollandica PCC 9006 = CALU 1027 TaxID=317619 RepID=A0A0M2PY64_PROHO|nr:RDD family protein [Prochlorothrix hollandica]KKJ01115.1 RDD domain-containing protein [Prochlorothrix hollandica PCC 9006 = CALU 1027]
MGLFNQITLQTPESVELEFTLAGIGNRVLAVVIDYLLLFTGLSLFLVLWSFMAEQTVDVIQQVSGDTDNLELWLAAIALLLFSIIYGGYFVAFECLWQGQTPGKRLTKIRVISNTGRPANLHQASLRTLLRPLDEFCFIGFFLVLLQRQEQRLGDLVAGTLVVQATASSASRSLHLSPQAQMLADYVLEQSDLSRLHPDDFGVVREYLRRRKHFNPQAKAKVSLELAERIRDTLGLGQIPAQTTADQFLEGVYVAYQTEKRDMEKRDTEKRDWEA